MTQAQAARQAVSLYEESLGASRMELKHVPLHYQMADLVTGLLKLAAKEGLDWSAIVRDGKEGLKPLPAEMRGR